jgi:hypothetical protein
MGNTVQSWFGESMYEYRDRYRTRVIPSQGVSQYLTGQKPPNNPIAAGVQERIKDREIPGYRAVMRLRKKYPHIRDLDLGHHLAMEKVSLSMPKHIREKSWIGGSTYYHYEGAFQPTVTYSQQMQAMAAGRSIPIPSDLGADYFALVAYGATAIAKSIPSVPDFSLPRFLGELREGLPKIPGAILKSEKKLRSVGGEYLNYQFGVMPTASDVQKLIELLMHPKAKEFIRRNLDEEFRVRKVLDKGESRTTTDLSGSYEMNTVSGFVGTPSGNQQRVQSYRIWSSVTFKQMQINRLNELINDLERQVGMGVVPTAIDLWNLVPWSWFVDWFTNFNDVITNLSYLEKNGLYLKYGYVMGTFKDVTTVTQTRSIGGVIHTTTGTAHYERRYRVGASPFGFGLTWKDFDNFQLSILGALGISRLRF